MQALSFGDHSLPVSGCTVRSREEVKGWGHKKYASLRDQTVFRHLDPTHPTSGRPHSSVGKESACCAEDIGDAGSIPGLRRPPREEMACHSSILAWIIPWTEEPGGLQSLWGLKDSDTTEQLSTQVIFQYRASLVAQWKRIRLQCRRPEFDLLVGKIPWRRTWQCTPVFLPPGQRSLMCYSPWGHKETRPSD